MGHQKRYHEGRTIYRCTYAHGGHIQVYTQDHRMMNVKRQYEANEGNNIGSSEKEKETSSNGPGLRHMPTIDSNSNKLNQCGCAQAIEARSGLALPL